MELSKGMELSKKIKVQSEQNFSLLLRYYKRGAIVPFIGSGFSSHICGDKFPQWHKFLIDYADKLGIQQEVLEILDDINLSFRYELAAAKIANCDATFSEKIQDSFALAETDTISSSALVQMLPELFPQGPLLTSNLDTVIETVYQLQGRPISQTLYGMSFTSQQLKRITSDKDHILLKIHGCIKDKYTIVFSQNQYEKLYGPLNAKGEHRTRESRKFPTQFKKMANSVRFLFLGCSLNEDRYLEILKQIKAHAKEDANYHFAIISAPNSEKEFVERESYLANFGISPIWYTAGQYEEIGTYLRRLSVPLAQADPFQDEKSAYCDPNKLSLYFIDPIAQMAHENNTDRNLTKAILAQSSICASTESNSQVTIAKLLKEITNINSNSICPLAIRGKPGTGKSTLLSLLFLNIPKPIGCYIALIDLHCYDEDKIDSASTMPLDFQQVLACIEKEIYSHESSILFIDGLNGYTRMNCERENVLKSKLKQWKKKSAVRYVFAIGELDTDQFPPFTRISNPTPFSATHTIELSPIDATTSEFCFLVENIIKTLSIEPLVRPEQKKSNARNALLDGLITFCKKLSGNKVEYRTAIFAARCYMTYGNSLFSISPGKVLWEHFLPNIMDRTELSNTAKHIALFMLNKATKPLPWTNSTVFKSPIFRDFFFAIYYLDTVETGDCNKISIFDCIFTPGINRFIVSILGQDKNREYVITCKLVDMFESLGTKAKSQATYLLGRVETPRSKKYALTFLKRQYKSFKDALPQFVDDEDQIMLFRSIGISLIYLGDKEYQEDFFSVLIYNESVRDINLKFHVTYYTTDAYRVGDDVGLIFSSLCNASNMESLYNFLFRSVTQATDKGRHGINVITIISLAIYQKYINNTSSGIIKLINLLSPLSMDTSITSPVLKKYILSIKTHLSETNIYASSLSKLYLMKTIQRSGWLEKGREIDKKARVESDADHTWGCCLLAQIFLSDRIEDCAFFSKDDKKKYAKTYQKSKVIDLLLVHDLPEIYTGDIPVSKQTADKKENEIIAMQKIAALDSFPFFHSFNGIEQLWHEYDIQTDINAVLAYQIDKIEPLVQLYIYRGALPESERSSQLGSWVQKASEQLSTCKTQISFGSNVLQFLSTYLLGNDFFIL